ncbi:MAG: Sua5/YciO/YrdC/YwlC family protein, partial [Bacteroidota bacterium]
VTDDAGFVINNPEIIRQEFENRVDLIIDGGINISEPSTVLDFTEEPPVVVREGAGDVTDLLTLATAENVIGKIDGKIFA